MGTSKPTILLAPTNPTSPLLADGPCGARVPTTIVHRHKDGSECANPRCGRAWFINTEQRALVLALDGVPVPEGVDRFVRLLRLSNTRRFGNPILCDHYTIEDVVEIVNRDAARLNCRVIVLDGGEVRDA